MVWAESSGRPVTLHSSARNPRRPTRVSTCRSRSSHALAGGHEWHTTSCTSLIRPSGSARSMRRTWSASARRCVAPIASAGAKGKLSRSWSPAFKRTSRRNRLPMTSSDHSGPAACAASFAARSASAAIAPAMSSWSETASSMSSRGVPGDVALCWAHIRDATSKIRRSTIETSGRRLPCDPGSAPSAKARIRSRSTTTNLGSTETPTYSKGLAMMSVKLWLGNASGNVLPRAQSRPRMLSAASKDSRLVCMA